MATEHHKRPRIALIMTGGGARAAYQVGVLRALSELVPPGAPSPFRIICGSSAGAINAAVLASHAGNFRRGVRRLMTVWKNFHAHQVYRADALGAYANSARWVWAALTGGSSGDAPVSLLDNAPLGQLLRRDLDLGGIADGVAQGHLDAFSVTCSGYASGQSVTFYQGASMLAGWNRVRRVGVAMPITVDHLLASSALPFIFPPVRINSEYFGDGSMRQIAPVSPALHLGADRVMVIGVGRQLQPEEVRDAEPSSPSLAQIAGHALHSIFLDGLEVDLERLQRINRTLELVPDAVLAKSGSPLRRVECHVMRPGVGLDAIAAAHAHELPSAIRVLLHTVGAMKHGGGNLLSYLLFEKGYCRALIRLGYTDTMTRRDEVLGFLGREKTMEVA